MFVKFSYDSQKVKFLIFNKKNSKKYSRMFFDF